MKMKKIDKLELEKEVMDWKFKNRPSERLGQMLLDLHDNILLHRNFQGYRDELKEEMRGASLVRLLKSGMRSYCPKDGRPMAFSYLTQCIFRNYITQLRNYYRRLNKWQAWVKDQVGYDFDISEGQDVVKEKYK